MSAAVRVRDPKAKIRVIYSRITAVEREFAGHMVEINCDYMPVTAVGSAEPLLAVALANLQAAVECVKAVRAAIGEAQSLGVHPYFAQE